MGSTPTGDLQNIVRVFENMHQHMKDMLSNFAQISTPIEGKNITLVTQEIVEALKNSQENNGMLKEQFDKLNQMINDYPFMKPYIARIPQVCKTIESMKKSLQDITDVLTKILLLKGLIEASPKIEPKSEEVEEDQSKINEEKKMKEQIEKNGNTRKEIEDTFEKTLENLNQIRKKFSSSILIAKVLSDRTRLDKEKDQFGTLLDGIQSVHSNLDDMAAKFKSIKLN
jgi:hypothetical protein